MAADFAMQILRKSKFRLFLLLLLAWGLMGGFIGPYLISQPSTLAVVIGVVLLIAMTLLTIHLTPNPYDKEPEE